MSRHRSSGSDGHSSSSLGGGTYRLHWSVDRYYAGTRGRFPRSCRRDTDMAGAIRFAKRWKPFRMPDEIKAAIDPSNGSAPAGEERL